MREVWKHLLVGSVLLFGAEACVDLGVANENNPAAAGSLTTSGDVGALLSGGFFNWFYGNYSYFGAGLALSNASFQHSSPWANSGMEKYGRLPRISFVNRASDSDYDDMTGSWFYSYKALFAMADVLRSLEDPEVSAGLTAEEIATAKAFGKFVQGMAHATVAVLFSEGFQVDETTPMVDAGGTTVPDPGDPLPYRQLMDAAAGYFDDCAALSAGASWVLPEDWMKAELTAPELARVAHSMKARYAAAVARSPEERQALDWNAIMRDVEQGITSDLFLFMDDQNGWKNDVLGYGTYFSWSQMAYFVYGMADQSGDFQLWNSKSLTGKSYRVDGTDILIVTPDLRFPQGTTIEEQRANPGRYFRISREGLETGSTWARPDRGTWRWSWYKHIRGESYWYDLIYNQPEIRMEEMRLLMAEGLYRVGDLAGAAEIVNETRVPAGLNATDAEGTNTSCVPRLPNGECGDLFEMLKWEKRMENTFKGPMGSLWYFDGRGWGDLWKDTFLQLPIPCGQARILGLLPCQTFGGPGGEGGAALSVYGWNGEG